LTPIYLIPFLGLLSFFTPCMWNLNLVLRAYVKKGGVVQFLYLLLSRFSLLNLIASFVYLLSFKINLSEETVFISQIFISLLLIFGFPLMRKLGVASIDLSPQFLFPKWRLPAGISLGLSIPYCSIPFMVLLSLYALSFGYSFIIFNLYALSATLPTVILIFLPEKFLKLLANLVPAVPAITGFLLIISLGLFINIRDLDLLISSWINERHSFMLLIPVMFLLGFLASLGPSTLPFLPVVFGILITKQKGSRNIVLSVAGFTIAFLLTHAFIGFIATLGTVLITDIFRTSVFNLLLSVILFLIALNLLNVLPFSLEVSRLNPFSNPGMNSFILGFAYTFSLCPSCTSILLGAIVLSATAGNVYVSALYMGVYALGRAVPIFLSGIVVSSMSEFLRKNYVYINKLVGLIFLILSIYFFKNFWEVTV